MENFVSPKFKIQKKPKDGKKGVCVGYIDARDCQDILDKKYGPECWQSLFYEVKGKTFCKIGIKIKNERVWKSDSGSLSDNQFVDGDTTSKGETSDAFKRACVMRGIGRYLYSLPTIRISEKEFNSNKYDLTNFVKNKYKKELFEWYQNL